MSLPSARYRELLGTAIYVFNSNNSFIIELLLKNEKSINNWHSLIDKNTITIVKKAKETFQSREYITNLFVEIISIRNRIIHSFGITAPYDILGDNQVLSTKYKDGRQQIIDENFLLDFIKKNEALSDLLHDLRGH
ncbi:hypothetical protein [Saccharibacter sp. 17.LH.SD]|uniref:hypothetical protein n=1 Tax=Saccharibacter sp. 17.LH.SD TaxID=2689393 RepID=UPI001F1C1A46|nr:hypothetical protein [Saccharibacter sp. 17.LH.SD]